MKIMTKTVTVVGYLSQEGSKSYEQYAEIAITEPFNSIAQITITEDPGTNDNEKLVMDMCEFYGKRVSAVCNVDEHGDLNATPCCFKVVEASK